IGVRRPREAVDAAVLAAAIRVDRTIKGNIRRVVAGDNGAGRVANDLGLDWRRRVVFGRPAVVKANALFLIVAAGCVRSGTSSFEKAWIGGCGQNPAHKASLTAYENKARTYSLWKIKDIQAQFISHRQ